MFVGNFFFGSLCYTIYFTFPKVSSSVSSIVNFIDNYFSILGAQQCGYSYFRAELIYHLRVIFSDTVAKTTAFTLIWPLSSYYLALFSLKHLPILKLSVFMGKWSRPTLPSLGHKVYESRIFLSFTLMPPVSRIWPGTE